MGCRNSRIKFRGYAYVMQEQGAASAAPPCESKVNTTNVDFTPNGNNLIINKPPVNIFPPVDITNDVAALAALAVNQFNPPPMDLIPPSFGMLPPPLPPSNAGFLDQFPNFDIDFQAFASLMQPPPPMPKMDSFFPQLNESVVPGPLAMPFIPPMKEPLMQTPLAMPPQFSMIPPLQIPPLQKQMIPTPLLPPLQQIPQMTQLPPIQPILSNQNITKQLRPVSSLSNILPLPPSMSPAQKNFDQLFNSFNRFNIQPTPNPFMNIPPSTPLNFPTGQPKPFLKPIHVQ